MASFTVNIHDNGEGDMDTSLNSAGNSTQRTMECIFINNGHNDMKQLHRLSDGEVYTDVVDVVSAGSNVAGNPLVS